MTRLYKISNNLWFWRIMFFTMALIAFVFGCSTRTETIIKKEYIYLIYDHQSDSIPETESRWM